MVKSPADSSSWYRAAFLVLLLALILQAVGFSTSSWSVDTFEGFSDVETYRRTGLWQHCAKFVLEICDDGSVYKGQRWFVAVQVCESVGLSLLFIGWAIAVVLMVFVTSSFLTKLNINICSIAGIFIVAGTGIYTIKKHTDNDPDFDQLGYSCWLCWFASFAIAVAAILLECDRRVTSARNIGAV